MIKYDITDERIKIQIKIAEFCIKYDDEPKLVNNELNKLIDYIRDEAIINE